jgi:hypothetical protein
MYITRYSRLILMANSQISNFMKIRRVGAELLDAGGWTDTQTDMTKLIVAFRSFAKAPKQRRESHKASNDCNWMRHNIYCYMPMMLPWWTTTSILSSISQTRRSIVGLRFV